MTNASGVYGVRRRAREMALQLLFQAEFSSGGVGTQASSGMIRDMLRRFVADFNVEKEVAEYGSQIFLGVAHQSKEIDAIIQSHSAHWKVSRMGLVDLSVMRVAIYEMKFMPERLAPNIAINEAVEVAKKYGSTESGAFVNGILDHVARTL